MVNSNGNSWGDSFHWNGMVLFFYLDGQTIYALYRYINRFMNTSLRAGL